MSKQRLDRRTFLRGAGTVAIGLPLLEEMMPSVAKGAPGDAPARLVTLFFGLGLDPAWTAEKFAGPLAPYEALQAKMAFFTNVNMNQGEGGAHCENSPVVFVGEKNPNENLAGGASIDQLVRQAQDPTASTLVSGLWWRRGACDAQALRVYNPDGTARSPIKRPSAVFESLFGSVAPPDGNPMLPNPAATRERHLRRSVLDTVLSQYQRFTGPSSYLGQASKQKLELHLQSIREIERELAPSDDILLGNTPGASCVVPTAPSDLPIANYDQFTYGTGGGAPEITWQDFEKVFHLHADLYVAGLTCDLVRFGNLMFESAGGHMNLKGTYSALGQSTDFPGDSQHDAYFHGNQPHHARLYQHFAMQNLAYFLKQLDAVVEGARTLLDNTTVVIGTEYGWNHSSDSVFHAIAGGTARFKPGFYDQTLNAIDVYNAVLQGHGLPATIGKKTAVASEGDASSVLT